MGEFSDSVEMMSLVEVEEASARRVDGEEGWEYGRMELIGELGRKSLSETKMGGRLVAGLWKKRMGGEVLEEKRWWKEMMVVVVESIGEEEGVMDCLAGMMNNPLMRFGFKTFCSDTFWARDMDGDRHSLKKLCAFLG